MSTGTSYVYIITSKFGHVGIYDDKLRLQRKYEVSFVFGFIEQLKYSSGQIDIDTDPDSDLDVAASDPGWITDAVWMDNSKHMVYTSSLRSASHSSRETDIPLPGLFTSLMPRLLCTTRSTAGLD